MYQYNKQIESWVTQQFTDATSHLARPDLRTMYTYTAMPDKVIFLSPWPAGLSLQTIRSHTADFPPNETLWPPPRETPILCHTRTCHNTRWVFPRRTPSWRWEYSTMARVILKPPCTETTISYPKTYPDNAIVQIQKCQTIAKIV